MTDLEMAEAQIKKWDSLLYPQMYPVTLVKDFIRKAYLEGLKAGSPQWHKVADGDLPDGERVVLNQKGMATLYNPFLGFDGIGVIAWCEIPIYTGE